jgi:hypothetical protein
VTAAPTPNPALLVPRGTQLVSAIFSVLIFE